jgi:hypothetical protein
MSLFTAVVLVLLALLFLAAVGPLGLLLLLVAVVLFWYAFGPGSRGSGATTAS